jgi:hypothetical protein
MAMHTEGLLPSLQVRLSPETPNLIRHGEGHTTSIRERIRMVWNTFVQLCKGLDRKELAFIAEEVAVNLLGKPFLEFFGYKQEERNELQRAICWHDKQGRQLKGAATETYLNTLVKTHEKQDQVTLVPHLFVFGSHYGLPLSEIKSKLKAAIGEANTRFISIPIAIDGHITHLLIEKDPGIGALGEHTIEFFDPFGKAMDHPDNHIGSTTLLGMFRRWLGLEVPVSIKQIAETVRGILIEKNWGVEEDFRLIDHETQVQVDKHSCGMFIEEHFNKRVIEGISCDDIPAYFQDMRDNIEQTRHDAVLFLQDQLDNSNELPRPQTKPSITVNLDDNVGPIGDGFEFLDGNI